eukprot:6755103-Prymnesium_polylepis.1
MSSASATTLSPLARATPAQHSSNAINVHTTHRTHDSSMGAVSGKAASTRRGRMHGSVVDTLERREPRGGRGGVRQWVRLLNI